MKYCFCIFLLVLSFQLVNAQIPSIKDILDAADKRLEQVETLSFELDFNMKLLTDADTLNMKAIVYLRNAPADTLKVHHHLLNLTTSSKQIYNGDNILQVNMEDSSSLIIDTYLHGLGRVQGSMVQHLIPHKYFQPSYFINLLNRTSLIKKEIEETILGNEPVYAITFYFQDEQEFSNRKRSYYIRKKDYFPIGYNDWIDFKGMHQYKEYKLSNLVFNPVFNDTLFNLEHNIPDKNKLEFYTPHELLPLLMTGTFAPVINGTTIHDIDFDLAKHEGKVVVLDFWYRGCFACIKALPDLQKLSDELDSARVIIIGVNPFDNKESTISFLDKRGISLNSLHEAKHVAESYNVSAYPTLTIIDKKGKIAYHHLGWSENFHEEIREKILEEINR